MLNFGRLTQKLLTIFTKNAILKNVEAAKNVEVDSATIDYKRNDKGEIVKENGKEVYVIKAVLKKKTTSTNG